MKKKIEDLTLREVADICGKCDEGKIDGCPFSNVLMIDCFTNIDEERRTGLDKKIEIEDEETNLEQEYYDDIKELEEDDLC